ncbi:MAG: mercuric ion transport protein [Crocinitomicaceae bacterium]|jgi:mercuric ion transport protein
MSTKKSKGVIFTGVIAAIAASSCCIPPVIAAIAGVGGASSSLAWMEPFRPYLIGLAILAIGYAWYAHLKTKQVDDCGCDVEKPKFFQRRSFLIGMTVFAALSIGFPYYSGIFISDNQKEVILTDKSQLQKLKISIVGMTCDACQVHVDHAVNELEGIVAVKSSYSDANSIITYDKSQTSRTDIKTAINSTGYSVTEIIEISI